MNMKRGIGFAVMLYVSSFIIYMILAALGLISMEEYTLTAFVIGWIVNIPLVLLLAKWYFKQAAPTLRNGIHLGVLTIIVSLILDGLMVAGALAAGESLEQFKELYTSWPFYVTVFEIILLTAYAGYEFDGTYTAPEKTAK